MAPKSDPFSRQSARSLRYARMARRPIRAIARKARWARPGLQRICAPSMGAVLRVQVPSKGDHPDRSKPQLQKGDRLWRGSGERNREPMYKNPIGGAGWWDERASDREVPMVKTQSAQIGRLRDEGQCSYLGRARPMSERTTCKRSEQSAEVVVCARQRIGQEGSSPSDARMRSVVSKGGGNASPVEVRERYGKA